MWEELRCDNQLTRLQKKKHTHSRNQGKGASPMPRSRFQLKLQPAEVILLVRLQNASHRPFRRLRSYDGHNSSGRLHKTVIDVPRLSRGDPYKGDSIRTVTNQESGNRKSEFCSTGGFKSHSDRCVSARTAPNWRALTVRDDTAGPLTPTPRRGEGNGVPVRLVQKTHQTSRRAPGRSPPARRDA